MLSIRPIRAPGSWERCAACRRLRRGPKRSFVGSTPGESRTFGTSCPATHTEDGPPARLVIATDSDVAPASNLPDAPGHWLRSTPPLGRPPLRVSAGPRSGWLSLLSRDNRENREILVPQF